MTYSLSLILTIAVTFLGAGFVKGVTGMGLPTVAMGILGALISPLAAASLLIIPSFITNLWQLLAGPSFGQLMLRLWSMMLAIAVGTIAGTAVLVGGNIAVTTSMRGFFAIQAASFAGRYSVTVAVLAATRMAVRMALACEPNSLCRSAICRMTALA